MTTPTLDEARFRTPRVTLRADGTATYWLGLAIYVMTSSARLWNTGELVRDAISAMASNPNYGPGVHPMWCHPHRTGVGWTLLPALLDEGEQPDLYVEVLE